MNEDVAISIYWQRFWSSLQF